MYHSSTMSNPPFRARHEKRSKIIPGFTIGICFGGEAQSPLFLSISPYVYIVCRGIAICPTCSTWPRLHRRADLQLNTGWFHPI
jgi:hypothetical protein